VKYFEDGKYLKAYNVLNKVGELPYIEAYVRYYRGLAALNSFSDENNLKKGLADLYYAELNSSVLSEPVKENLPTFEMKLAHAVLDNKHCKAALPYYSKARVDGFTSLDDEFKFVRSYAKYCDKKEAVSLFMDLYVRFGEQTVKPFETLNEGLRNDIKQSIENLQKLQATTTTKPAVQSPEAGLFNSIKAAVDSKNYSKFVELSREYLKMYANSQKQNSKFYSSFSPFVEDALLQKTRSVSYFDDLFDHYDRDQLERLVFKTWQKEDWTGTRDLLDIMTKQFPGYDKAYYLKGLLLEDTKKYSRAYDAYNYVLYHFPDQRFYAPALFKLGWLKMIDGKNADCAAAFERYTNEGGENYDWAITSAYYYRAKCLQKENMTDDAKKVKLELISKFPFAFYSLLAMDELGMKIPEELEARIKPQTYVAEPVSAREFNILNTADMLVRVSQYDFAKKELSSLNLEKLPAEYVETVSKLYAMAGYHDLAMQASTALLSRLKVFVSREHVEYHFPKHYFDFVKRYAEKMELDPFLIMAVMKRESAFNNDAVSRSGAVGLMQLLPATADRFRSSKKEDIRDSGTNIKLAAMYLKDLVKRYNGNLAYAAAAYNSGEEALDRWIKWYGDRLSGTEFIENIPYSETRAYVKSVLGNYFMYNAVYLKKHVTFDEVVKGGVK
jgi:soluble lytic murein transglycosylase-like protein